MGAVRRVVSTSSLEIETQQQENDDGFANDDIPSLQSTPQNYKQKARVYICLSYLLSELSEWIFQFSTVVWLTSIGDSNSSSGSGSSAYSSLFLNSAYQATSQLLVCFLVPRITTRYVSNNNRRCRQTSMSYIIRMQIPCILITTLLFGMLLVHTNEVDGDEHDDGLADYNNATEVAQDVSNGGDSSIANSIPNSSSHHFITLIIIYICGGLAQVYQQCYMVAIDRDWVVAISGGDDEQWLTTTNTVLKQIHLVCIIVGPSIAVLLNSNSQSDAIWVGLIKITSLVLMNVLLNRCYQTTPSLQQSEDSSIEQSEEERRTIDAEDDNVDHVDISSIVPKNHSCSYMNDLQVFLSQEAVFAGLALALLYCNVLTFGGVMTAYLSSCGMPWSVIGVCQGLSNFSGLIGTCVFAISQRYLNIRTTTMIGISWQFICLTIVISGVLMNLNQTDKLLSAKLIIVGVIPSRIGLWIFALASTQLYQQTVESKFRGQVGGTQASLNSMFEFIPFILGMVYSDVDDYWIVMVVSYISVSIATLMVAFGVFIPHQRKRMKAEYDNIELEDMTTRSNSNNGIV